MASHPLPSLLPCQWPLWEAVCVCPLPVGTRSRAVWATQHDAAPRTKVALKRASVPLPQARRQFCSKLGSAWIQGEMAED